MADQIGRIFQGAAVVSFAPFIDSAGGAHPTGHVFVDVGAILGGVGIDWKRDYHDIKSDHAMNLLEKIKIGDVSTITFEMEESALANLAMSQDQPASNVTGTFPAQVLARTPNSPRQLLCMKIVGTNANSQTSGTATRTITAWKCVVTEVGKSMFKKEGEFMVPVTVSPLQMLNIVNAGTSQDVHTVDT
jgi:hypothetical protein